MRRCAASGPSPRRKKIAVSFSLSETAVALGGRGIASPTASGQSHSLQMEDNLSSTVRCPKSRNEASFFFYEPIAPTDVTVPPCAYVFVLNWPPGAGDTVIYDQLATNWLPRRANDTRLRPTAEVSLFRGHPHARPIPAFLAIVYALGGRVTRADEAARRAVILSRAFVDYSCDPGMLVA